MNRFPVRCGLLGLIGLIAISFGLGKPTMTSAASPTIGPVPSATFLVNGLWHDNGVYLAAPVEENPLDEQISITDASYLRVGWTVKVGSEQMYIRQLVDNPSGSDTMVVYRGENGTGWPSHGAGSSIQSHSVTIDIWAQDVSDPSGYGLGGFAVDLTLPSNVQMIKFTPNWTWLASTGRVPDCSFSTTWEASCFTNNNPQPGQPTWYPPGPSGSGKIARVVLLPLSSEVATVPLTGSHLLNVAGSDLAALALPIVMKPLDCPDVNADQTINSTDLYLDAINGGEGGVDTQVTLSSAMNASTNSAQISDQSLLHVNDKISIDAEIMSVTQLTEGTPDTMMVTRAIYNTQANLHKVGAHIYRGTVDGNHDGIFGYTRARDVDGSGTIDSTDLYIIASVPTGTVCPALP